MSSLGLPDGWSPWTPRPSTSSTPAPTPKPKPDEEKQSPAQQGGDHKINPRYWLSSKEYPKDCPPLNVRWYFAVDVPKRKPANFLKPGEKSKPLVVPKKYSPFTDRDSRSIEQTFQKLATDTKSPSALQTALKSRIQTEDEGDVGSRPIPPSDDARGGDREAKVPVNEDFLFDVNIDKRELAPAYWLGPIYDVRRATWFYDSGSSNRPCEENLATQLEEGYLKTKPWRNLERKARSASQPKRPSSWVPNQKTEPDKLSPGSSNRAPSAERLQSDESNSSLPAKLPLQTYRLFGAHMNSIVTYEDATTAYILTDDFMSRMSSSMYERFAGGAHFGGIKVVRGFVEAKVKETRPKDDDKKTVDGRSRSQPARREDVAKEDAEKLMQHETEAAAKRQEIARQITSFVGTSSSDQVEEDEQVRKRQEREMQDDYRDQDGAQQNREIEHLVLVTHGIGQRLGMKMESLNFIHDVNTLRKTLKSVYDDSADLQALNMQVDQIPKNSRVQVLPIVWRHLLDFPHQSIKQRKKEHDISDPDEELDYPQLNDITIEGVAPIRNLIEDLFLDILLYQSTYREHVAGIVQKECNRVYKLFKERNPDFNGKVSLIGHSLGSAIFFDLLCRQKDPGRTESMARVASKRRRRRTDTREDERGDFPLDFDVEDLYCLGSPIGLFQMIKGRTIAGRRSAQGLIENDTSSAADPFNVTVKGSNDDGLTSVSVSSPKCSQLYNIFFPTDPIAYRLEPLVSPVMSNLKPQPLPQVKKGIFSTQGLQGIGSRVGQSVSGLWSSMTTGIASSMLSRTLGMDGQPQSNSNLTRTPLSMGAGPNRTGGQVAGAEELEAEKKKRAAQGDARDALGIEHPPTLIDSDIETLYAGFEKRRHSVQKDSEREHGANSEWQESENRARQYRREEAKIRALNSNGRVDYAIQDSYLDISLISSITSHLSYWTDEDFSHFMISQLLSRQRVVKR